MSKHLQNTFIDTIEHKYQRYMTCGDWFKEKEYLRIRVSQFPDPDYEFLVALHEFIESYLCKKHGITGKSVDDFDMNFMGEGEPGDCKEAPYHIQHVTATLIERVMASLLEVSWKEYELAINSLPEVKA